jgi:hypothetical protein
MCREGILTYLTVKPFVKVAVPPEVLTDTFLGPRAALAAMVMLAVIWVGLFTMSLFTVIFEPKLTDVARVR